jgi:probable rRNA maturation factor
MKVNVQLARPRCHIDYRESCPVDPKYAQAARRGICAVLSLLSVPVNCVVELWMAGKNEVHALNRHHRQKDKPTDVLSFPMHELSPHAPLLSQLGKGDLVGSRLFLGSIVISVETALAQAQAYGHSPEREFAFLAAHSTLHLLGYDHENNEEGERCMLALQKAALRALSLPR